jgi:hypothetical protein
MRRRYADDGSLLLEQLVIEQPLGNLGPATVPPRTASTGSPRQPPPSPPKPKQSPRNRPPPLVVVSSRGESESPDATDAGVTRTDSPRPQPLSLQRSTPPTASSTQQPATTTATTTTTTTADDQKQRRKTHRQAGSALACLGICIPMVSYIHRERSAIANVLDETSHLLRGYSDADDDAADDAAGSEKSPVTEEPRSSQNRRRV